MRGVESNPPLPHGVPALPELAPHVMRGMAGTGTTLTREGFSGGLCVQPCR